MALARPPNVVVVLIDDLDLERVPAYVALDAGAAAQAKLRSRGRSCATGHANCSYTAPAISGVGRRGALFLGAHVPVPVCTPSRFAVLSGRLPSSSPVSVGTKFGATRGGGTVLVTWDTWISVGNRATSKPCCAPGEAAGSGCITPRPGLSNCVRTVATLGSRLQAASYFTGFVGKWHLSPRSDVLEEFFKGKRGSFGAQPPPTAEAAAREAALLREYSAARRDHVDAAVRAAGFNFTGALTHGNVVDAVKLGVGVHNMEWHTAAALEFIGLAAEHARRGRAAGFYLHFCPTLSHSPGPKLGICANELLTEGGPIAAVPTAQPSRASVMARAGRHCAMEEQDAAHTLWVDDAVGALLGALRDERAEDDTLFIALADHQRIGKGTFYHGVRTPMVLQWPARVRAGQTLPASTLVTSLDIVPTVLDAAGLPPPTTHHARLDGRSLLPLLTGGGGGGEAGEWRSSLFFELGVGASVKHRSGWQIAATHFPSNMTISTGAARAPAGAHIHCWHERLRGGGGATGAAVRTRECAWNSTGAAVPLNVFGEARVRFQINDMYPHYHDAEQLLHSSDLMLQHTWRRRCPRQLACMQRLLRAHALRRRHFDGSPVAWGTYTAGDDEWAAFGGRRGPSDAECEAVLALPPERCGEGMAGERSARSCEELRAAPLPPLSEAAVALDADEAGAALSVAAAPPIQCAAERGDCREARCCQDADARCYGTLLEMAKCLRVRCIADNIWSCDELPPLPLPPPAAAAAAEPAAAGRPTWAAAAGGGCGESRVAGGGGCVGAVTHGAAVSACRAVGARLCAAHELRAGRAAGSGCDLDAARVWSATACGDGDGRFWSLGGAPSAVADECTHAQRPLPVRCCADEAVPSPPPSPPWPPSPPSPPPSPPPPTASPSLKATECADDFHDCWRSRCCTHAGHRCFVIHEANRYAQCRPHGCAKPEWSCRDITLTNRTIGRNK